MNAVTRSTLVLALFLCVAAGCQTSKPEASAVVSSHANESAAQVAPSEALARLKAGNQRFVSGNLAHPNQTVARRVELAGSQAPFAIILGCTDSRTAPELLFDQGLGDLFVVRVAGNVVNAEGLGSIEYAVEHLGSRLIVVLGHERCGAVKAAQDALAAHAAVAPHIDSLVAAIKPAIDSTPGGDLAARVKENVRLMVQTLRTSAPVLHEKITRGEISVVGADYDLDSGSVVFLKND